MATIVGTIETVKRKTDDKSDEYFVDLFFRARRFQFIKLANINA